MKICYFGTYDKTYSSNKLVLQGLAENNVSVLEINAHIKVTKLTTTSDMSAIQIIKRVLKKYRLLTEILKNVKKLKSVDAIYVGYPGHVDVFPAYIIAKIFKKKLVFNPLLIVSIGFSDEQGILKKNSIYGRIIKSGEKLAYNLCDLVFADTALQKAFMVKDFGLPAKKLRILPIGADNKGYEYSIYKNPTEKVNVVYYGLYSPSHGVEHIIEAAHLLQNNKNITFTLVGNGNTYVKNYKRAVNLRLKNVNFYTDVLEGAHLELLQKSDIFLGFLQKSPIVDRVIPNKVYQGLALGRAVLTADAPVTRSAFLHKENVYLVKQGDPKALANAILELSTSPNLRAKIAKNGYELYSKEFNPKSVGKKLIKYMEEII